jgi:hypothetical protein
MQFPHPTERLPYLLVRTLRGRRGGALLLALVACTAGQDYIVNKGSESLSGGREDANIHPSTVFVYYDAHPESADPNRPVDYASGVIVGPHLVATAAHIVDGTSSPNPCGDGSDRWGDLR